MVNLSRSQKNAIKKLLHTLAGNFPRPWNDNEIGKHGNEPNTKSLPEDANVRLMKAFGKAMDEKEQSL